MTSPKASPSSRPQNFGFCEECGSILLPKKGGETLFCRVCNKEYPIANKEHLSNYKSSNRTVISQKERLKKQKAKTAIIDKDTRTPSISEDDRDAYEDYFESESEGYEE